MKFPKCSEQNRDGAKFCKKCGVKLDSLCPNCRHLNDPDSLFCDECGSNLHETKRQGRIESETESERKFVTIIFSDLSGYTALTERLDPEEVKDIMSGIFGDIAQIITKYEGFIERFIGDAVMAIFGVPHAHEDDPIRAILAAGEIHEIVEKKGHEIGIDIGRSFQMHTGINTGLVVTGEVNLKKGTHGVTGDAINLASRLEGLAQPGEIIVGQETYMQAKNYFNFEVLKPQKVKGKRRDITTYRVIDSKSIKTRFEISAARGLTPLVGRNIEIERLLKSFDQITKGHGQVINIVGEPSVEGDLQWIPSVDLFLAIQHLLNQVRVGRIAFKDYTVNEQANAFQLHLLRMAGSGFDQRHLFLLFLAHFVFGLFLVCVVILGVWENTLYYIQ